MPPARTFGALWRRTPPAVFAPILGLVGLGLAWRRASDVFGLGPAPSDMLLGATAMVFLFALGSYAAKVARRPAALIEDLRVLPGRAGLAAGAMSVMALAAALVPIMPGIAGGVLYAGLALHAALAVLVGYVLLSGPAELRQVTPTWHLTFVGFIVAPAAALPLGLTGLTTVIYYATMAGATAIYAVSLVQLWRRSPPPPLRPLLAIHLAPVSLFGIAALGLGQTTLAQAFAIVASVVLAALLARLRALLAAGFTPLWGAFTFPLAAYAGMLLALVGEEALLDLRIIAAAALAGATLAVPWIAAKVLQGWARGTLAAETNAAAA